MTVTVLLTACTTGGGSAADREPTNLTFWMTGSADEAAVVQSAADLYRQTNSKVSVKVQAISRDDAHARILAAATARTGPDIVAGDLSWGIEFGELGATIDLRGYDIDGVRTETKPGLWNSVQSRDGSVYAVPLDITLYVTYYRPDVFAQAGITSTPQTWTDLTAALDKLEAAKVRYPMAFDWGVFDWLSYFNFLKQSGGSFYDARCTTATIDSDAAVTAAIEWAQMHRTYRAPTSSIDIPAGLASGDIGMSITGHWYLKDLDAAQPGLAGRWSTFPLPAGVQAGSLIGGRVSGVMAHSRNARAAAEFVKWTYTDEAVAAMQRTASSQGALWISPREPLLSRLDVPQNWKDTLSATMNTAEGPPSCKGWGRSQSEVTRKLQSIVAQNADPRAVLRDAAAIMNDNLR